jgi:hypothetical protein
LNPQDYERLKAVSAEHSFVIWDLTLI